MGIHTYDRIVRAERRASLRAYRGRMDGDEDSFARWELLANALVAREAARWKSSA